jgi:hypothetical protein
MIVWASARPVKRPKFIVPRAMRETSKRLAPSFKYFTEFPP